jgi:hypothetical protein
MDLRFQIMQILWQTDFTIDDGASDGAIPSDAGDASGANPSGGGAVPNACGASPNDGGRANALARASDGPSALPQA